MIQTTKRFTDWVLQNNRLEKGCAIFAAAITSILALVVVTTIYWIAGGKFQRSGAFAGYVLFCLYSVVTIINLAIDRYKEDVKDKK